MLKILKDTACLPRSEGGLFSSPSRKNVFHDLHWYKTQVSFYFEQEQEQSYLIPRSG